MYVYVYSCMFAGLKRRADQDTGWPVYEAVFNGNSLKSSKIVNFAFFTFRKLHFFQNSKVFP